MHDTLEARTIFSPCQILSLEFEKSVQLTPGPFQDGVPDFETAILGF